MEALCAGVNWKRMCVRTHIYPLVSFLQAKTSTHFAVKICYWISAVFPAMCYLKGLLKPASHGPCICDLGTLPVALNKRV